RSSARMAGDLSAWSIGEAAPTAHRTSHARTSPPAAHQHGPRTRARISRRHAIIQASVGSVHATEEPLMNEDVFNTSIRKFLKTLGVTARREIERAVRQALADGRLKGNEKLPAKATVTIAGAGLTWPVDGEIELE